MRSRNYNLTKQLSDITTKGVEMLTNHEKDRTNVLLEFSSDQKNNIGREVILCLYRNIEHDMNLTTYFLHFSDTKTN